MMLKAPATHAAYEKILAAIAHTGSMRTWEVCALLSDHSISRVRSWLTLLCARGHLRVAQETTFRSDGGHLYALGAVPLPPFDDAEQRRVYERAAACYAKLHAVGSAGMTAPALLAACSEGVSLAVMSSRLLVWERKGRVRCDRSTRPARWFAVAPLMLGYTDMLAAEAHRRATTPMPQALRMARVRSMAEARSRRQAEVERQRAEKAALREERRMQRLIARMPVAAWVSHLLPPEPRLRSVLDALPRSPMMGA